jgi:glycosyltransferase involved in cell wall biosynthesis
MKLSICIATMPQRSGTLAMLIARLGMTAMPHTVEAYHSGTLTRFTDEARSVEVLCYATPRYDKRDEALSYGGKRNALMNAALGDYVAFFDDDDEPHPDYLGCILAAIAQRPDVVGFKVACYGYANGCKSPEIMEPADVSIRYKGWANDQNGFKYVRYPHHLAPTKREHAMAIGYRGHYGEDHDYSMRMEASGRLKTEVHIDEFLYIYRFDSGKSIDK